MSVPAQSELKRIVAHELAHLHDKEASAALEEGKADLAALAYLAEGSEGDQILLGAFLANRLVEANLHGFATVTSIDQLELPFVLPKVSMQIVARELDNFACSPEKTRQTHQSIGPRSLPFSAAAAPEYAQGLAEMILRR